MSLVTIPDRWGLRGGTAANLAAVNEVPLERVNTVAGESLARMRIIDALRRSAEELQRQVAIEVEFQVSFGAVDPHGAERVGRVGRVGLVETRCVEQ